ncbi:MAG: metal transporter ATP-binding protein [Candidatus Saccharibacteria bacterium]|nr:metal transporter ATP-binding protein [Candidatus Saccharibacteria bacterium]
MALAAPKSKSNVASQPLLSLHNASLRLGNRTLWKDLSLDLKPGEFLAVLGPNGAGKTSLLKVLLGLNSLKQGSIELLGQPPHKGNSQIGYIPQQKAFDRDLPVRGRDLVHFGLDGHRFGFVRHDQAAWQRVDEVIKEVGASAYANNPIGRLSGGEQQRLRIAQALLAKPELLLCDEPLLSLDLKSQQAISELIDSYRKRYNTSVIFVTHDINPILSMVDRVLYLVGGKWAVGKPDEILTTKCLSQLYGTPVDVLRVRDRIIVVNTVDQHGSSGQHHVGGGEH